MPKQKKSNRGKKVEKIWNKLSPKALCRKANKDSIKKIIELIEVEKKFFNTITYDCKDFK